MVFSDKKYLADPMLLIKDLAEYHSVDLSKGSKWRTEGSHNPNLLRLTLENELEDYHVLSLCLETYDPSIDMEMFDVPRRFGSYLHRNIDLNGKNFNLLNFHDGSIKDFEGFAKNITIGLDYSISKTGEVGIPAMPDAVCYITKQGRNFKVSSVSYQQNEDNGNTDVSPQFLGTVNSEVKGSDFRPWFHRAFELFTGVPKEKKYDLNDYEINRPTKVNSRKRKGLDEKVDYGDPFKFLQERIKETGVESSSVSTEDTKIEERVDAYLASGDFHKATMKRSTGFDDHLLEVYLVGRPERDKEEDFTNFVRGTAFFEKDGLDRMDTPCNELFSSFSEFKPFKHDTSFFGELKAKFDIHIQYFRAERGYDTDNDITVCLGTGDKKGHSLKEMRWTGFANDDDQKRIMNKNRKLFGIEDMKSANGDWRPYLHRIVEVWAGTPLPNRHDPAIYSPNGSTRELEQVVNSTVDLLFTGSERSQIEEKLKQAKLNMRKGWASVPRLSLGAIKLPTPGQNNALDDDFVIDAAPFFVEYMSTLGVMDAKEAEAIMAQRLTNYFIHKAGFQLNRSRAESLVNALNGSELVQRIA